jgi:ATP-dependent RNA helicase RhlE
VRALIIAPTRELAAQVEASVRTYGAPALPLGRDLRGVGFGPQADCSSAASTSSSPRPAACSTTRRSATSTCRRSRSRPDEADRMLDRLPAGYPARLRCFPPSARTCCSRRRSPTKSAPGRAAADNPRTIEVAPRNATIDAIRQRVVAVGRDRKRELLSFMIGRNR